MASTWEECRVADRWKAVVSPETRRPTQWAATADAREFIASVRNLNATGNGIWKSRRGRCLSGVWAHKQVGLAHEKDLSPASHQFDNEAFR